MRQRCDAGASPSRSRAAHTPEASCVDANIKPEPCWQGPACVVDAMLILRDIRTYGESFQLKHSMVILLLQRSFGCGTDTLQRGRVADLLCADSGEKSQHNENTRADRGKLRNFNAAMKAPDGASLKALQEALEPVRTPMHLLSA